MTPVIKLIHDDERSQWICGDEDGNLVVVIDEVFEDTLVNLRSIVLQKRIVRADSAAHVSMAVVPASHKAVFTGEMTVWEVCDLVDNPPDFGELTVTLQTACFSGYVLRAHFSKEYMLWVVADSFEETTNVTTA